MVTHPPLHSCKLELDTSPTAFGELRPSADYLDQPEILNQRLDEDGYLFLTDRSANLIISGGVNIYPAEVDAVLLNGGSGEAPVLPVAAQRFDLQPTRFVSLDGARTLAVGGFGAGARVHALAGIGNPGRFFATLRSLGLDPREHPFADHHRYQPGDLAFGDGGPVVMTEKDAVKCRAFATPEHWYLAVEALLPPAFYGMLDARLAQALRRTAGATALS